MSRVPPIAVLCDQFGELSQTFITTEVRALAALDVPVHIESHASPDRADPAAGEGLDVSVWSAEGAARRIADMAWLAARAPRACARDLRAQRRWRREDEPLPLRMLAPAARRIVRRGDRHLHAHFAAGAALSALRLSRLLGIPYSVTAHGFDIFATPRNLAEKMSAAAFATSGSDFTVAALRRAAPRAELHKIVMGVDSSVWRRFAAPSRVGLVLAVGRLVEKKGFTDLVAAAVLLREDPAFERVVIVGDGPLHAALTGQIAEAGVEDVVELAGPRSPEQVRELLERAAVVCVPCVIAADGDADSMPVIAKEALAMEVPVVATDVAGLPEVVRPPWGRLVPAKDPPSLAAALREMLRLQPAERARMGAAGREFVVTTFDAAGEAQRLAALVESVATRRASPRGS